MRGCENGVGNAAHWDHRAWARGRENLERVCTRVACSRPPHSRTRRNQFQLRFCSLAVACKQYAPRVNLHPVLRSVENLEISVSIWRNLQTVQYYWSVKCWAFGKNSKFCPAFLFSCAWSTVRARQNKTTQFSIVKITKKRLFLTKPSAVYFWGLQAKRSKKKTYNIEGKAIPVTGRGDP
jgi:hypothetical protein